MEFRPCIDIQDVYKRQAHNVSHRDQTFSSMDTARYPAFPEKCKIHDFSDSVPIPHVPLCLLYTS